MLPLGEQSLPVPISSVPVLCPQRKKASLPLASGPTPTSEWVSGLGIEAVMTGSPGPSLSPELEDEEGKGGKGDSFFQMRLKLVGRGFCRREVRCCKTPL